MAREIILKCSLCNKKIDTVVAKIYLSPLVPGQWSNTMAAYSHHGDVCGECLPKIEKKLIRRKPRKNVSGEKS